MQAEDKKVQIYFLKKCFEYSEGNKRANYNFNM